MKRLIGIEGLPGSGKSTYAGKLATKLGCSYVSIDDFYLPLEVRNENSYLKGGNNIDYRRFISEVIKPFLDGDTISYSRYDCKTDTLIPRPDIPANDTLIIEGNYILREELSGQFTHVIYIRASQEEIRENIISRSGEEAYRTSKEVWIPLAKQYIDEYRIEESADEIITFCK